MKLNYDSQLRDICDGCDMSLTQVYFELKTPLEKLFGYANIDQETLVSVLNFLDEIRFSDLGIINLHNVVLINPMLQLDAIKSLKELVAHYVELPEMIKILNWIDQVTIMTEEFVRQ